MQPNVFGNGVQSKNLLAHWSWRQVPRERAGRKQKQASRTASLWSANQKVEGGFSSLQKRHCEIHCEVEAARKFKLSVTIYCFLSRVFVHQEKAQKSSHLVGQIWQIPKYSYQSGMYLQEWKKTQIL